MRWPGPVLPDAPCAMCGASETNGMACASPTLCPQRPVLPDASGVVSWGADGSVAYTPPRLPDAAPRRPLTQEESDLLRRALLASTERIDDGFLLPDAALSGPARHETADWSNWRPSYDGEDHDPGETWQRGDTE